MLALAPPARAEFGVSFAIQIGTSTAILNGTGTFTGFPTAPGISYCNLVFLGLGSGDQIGVYAKLPVYSPSDPYKVMADLNSLSPGGSGNFTDFALIGRAFASKVRLVL